MMIMRNMRTTMSLPDDVLDDIRKYAESHSVSIGEATAELVRRGLSRPAPTHIVSGLRVFSAPPGGPEITAELVKELDSEQDVERVMPYMRGRRR
jgi:hypothetical protein